MTTQEILAGLEGVTIEKRAIRAPEVLNEAYDYCPRPSSFSRGLRLDIGSLTVLLISGTASVDEHGKTVHVGDFRAQTQRMFHNVTGLLTSDGATWKDVVRTRFYLRDIDRDYAIFNEERTAFYDRQNLNPLPASTAIEAKICRPDLLVEMEAIALLKKSSPEA